MIFHAKRVLQKKNYRIDCTALIKCIKIGLKNNMGRKGAASKYNIVMYQCMFVRIVLEAGKIESNAFRAPHNGALGHVLLFAEASRRLPSLFHAREISSSQLMLASNNSNCSTIMRNMHSEHTTYNRAIERCLLFFMRF